MPITLHWQEIAVRLLLTVVGGALIGLNRTEGGRAAGLRTTILVCLAASVAMIQANSLMPTTGKTPDSFVVFDVMRLPLGILTGMGFIGAGAILRQGEQVRGVTTAATLWLVTVIGLCFGGGQIGLGIASVAIALIVLWGLKQVEDRLNRDRSAKLTLQFVDGGMTEEQIRAELLAAGFHFSSWDIIYRRNKGIMHFTLRCELRWRERPGTTEIPAVVHRLQQQPGVRTLRWNI